MIYMYVASHVDLLYSVGGRVAGQHVRRHVLLSCLHPTRRRRTLAVDLPGLFVHRRRRRARRKQVVVHLHVYTYLAEHRLQRTDLLLLF